MEFRKLHLSLINRLLYISDTSKLIMTINLQPLQLDLNHIELEFLSNEPAMNIIKSNFGSKFDPNEIYLICVQGPSTSGKSTFTKSLKCLLMYYGLSVLTVHLDNYYKSTGRDVENYDFDNPAAWDWSKINELFKAIENRDEKLPQYSYSFETWICRGPTYVKNIKPNVVIVEGIYAFNSINKNVFNVTDLDPYDTNKEVQNIYVPNPYTPSFKSLKINLTNCYEKSKVIRIERDVKERGRSYEDAKNQFDNFSWPSACKWVLTDPTNVDIRIVHGSFNEKQCQYILGCITNFFFEIPISLQEIKVDMDVKNIAKDVCSNECIKEEDARVVLYD